MPFIKPTDIELFTVQPAYNNSKYATELPTATNEAFLTHGTNIGLLPTEMQLYAYGLAVCHVFSLNCYAKMGYSSAPVELSSRNSKVRFSVSGSQLGQTMCGSKLEALFRANLAYGLYASDNGYECGDCGIW